MLVPKPLPSAAGHYLLRQSKLSASGRKLSDMPMALPLGELARERLRGQGRWQGAVTAGDGGGCIQLFV